MITRYYICLLLLICAGGSLAYSQSIRPDPVPKSFTYSSHTKPLTNENNIETMVLPVPNVDSVVRIEKILDAKGITRPYRFGISIPISFSIHEHGTVDQLENGGRLWRMKFVCPGAQSVNFMLHSYTATQGAFLYTYNSQKSDLEGPWYDKNTRQGKRLGIFPVGGKVVCSDLRVRPTSEWPDFVFDANYTLMPLHELEQYVQENKHLPEVPTSAEVEKDGVSVNDMIKVLIKKQEEMTLYMIEMKKENAELRSKLERLVLPTPTK